MKDDIWYWGFIWKKLDEIYYFVWLKKSEKFWRLVDIKSDKLDFFIIEYFLIFLIEFEFIWGFIIWYYWNLIL